MSQAAGNENGHAPQPKAISFAGVSLWTPAGAMILNDIDWAVDAGQRWALIGPNGSGKSSTLSLAGARRHPSKGTVAVLGGTLGKVDMPALRQSIGVVDAGGSVLNWLTAEDVVLTGIGSTFRPLWWAYSPADHERARMLLALFGCGHLADREIGTCSQGERGRIRIARALMGEPRLLLLDEPAVGLDLAAREAFIVALDRLSHEQADLTTVLVTHHLEEIPGSTTHALLLREGAVVAAGEIHSTLSSDTLSTCFGFSVECHHDGSRWYARAPAHWSGTHTS
jgi:iron complex transport system ATP-binding protein